MLKFRGAQGTTGTRASFLEIFQGDSAKCEKLNELLCKKFGFPACYPVSTQTYTRKVDLIIANAVAGIGSSAQKMAADLRHLANWKEIEEPFESSQIGSSAMVRLLQHLFDKCWPPLILTLRSRLGLQTQPGKSSGHRRHYYLANAQQDALRENLQSVPRTVV